MKRTHLTKIELSVADIEKIICDHLSVSNKQKVDVKFNVGTVPSMDDRYNVYEFKGVVITTEYVETSQQ